MILNIVYLKSLKDRITHSKLIKKMTLNAQDANLVFDFVKGKTFDEVKTICENEHIKIRELDNEDSKNLYLLVLDEDVLLKNSQYFRELNSSIEKHQEELNLAKESGNFDLYKQILEVLKKERQELSKYVKETKLTNQMTDLQLMLNGMILEKNTNTPVCMCYKRMYDISSKQEDINTLSYSDITVDYCEDGTVIRLYHYNNKWFTATRRCIDAKYSYWSGLQNFDEMFWDIIEDKELFLSMLDTNATYFFVLKHTDNRIVVKNQESSLVYLGSVNNSTLNEDFELNYKQHNIHFTEKVNMGSFDTNDKVDVNNLVSASKTSSKRGLIITTRSGIKYKLDFEEFTYLKELRGNTPFIRMRILELLSDKEKLASFMQNYNEYMMTYTMITVQLNELVKSIHKLYIDTHVKRRFIIDSENINFKIIKQLHNKFKETKTPIIYSDVEHILQKTQPMYLKTLLGWKH